MLPPDDEITRYLFVPDEPAAGHLAIVLGSAEHDESARRGVRAAELYHEGAAPRLLFAGGDPAGRGRTEAERMAEAARAEGVPDAALRLETRSRTTWENARFCRELLEQQGG